MHRRVEALHGAFQYGQLLNETNRHRRLRRRKHGYIIAGATTRSVT
jgi:hypothetical protein